VTPKQERFVAEYLIDLNATQAAIRAGYAAKDADVTGPRLLGTAGISAAVAKKQAAHLAKLEIRAEDVLRELAYLGMQRADDFFDDDGNLLPVKDMPERAKAALADHDLVTGNLDAGDGQRDKIVKIRKWSKTEALRDLAKHFRLLDEHVDVTINVNLDQRLVAGRERAGLLPEAR
jgi:phage terminase small subunit